MPKTTLYIIYYNEKKRMCPQKREDSWQSLNDKKLMIFIENIQVFVNNILISQL